MEQIYAEGDMDRRVYLLGTGQVVGVSKKASTREGGGGGGENNKDSEPSKREVFLTGGYLLPSSLLLS
jgi:hypothetical protein